MKFCINYENGAYDVKMKGYLKNYNSIISQVKHFLFIYNNN